MNIDFIKLSDGSVVVTDENGHIIPKKKVVSIESLMLENKIEVVDKKIQTIDKKLKDNKELRHFGKLMLIAQPCIVLAIMFVGSILGYSKAEGAGAIAYGLVYGLGSTMLVGTAISFWAVVNVVTKRKIKKLDHQLEKAKELKEKFEKELTGSKEKQTEFSVNPGFINKPLTLEKQNQTQLSKIEEEIKSAYTIPPRAKTKRLVLEYKNKK